MKPAIGAAGIVGDDKIAKVSLVGIGMRTHAGIAAKMFGALAGDGVNIQMISTSEIKTSVVVDEKYMELAVRVLHKTFELDKTAHRREDEAVRAYCDPVAVADDCPTVAFAQDDPYLWLEDVTGDKAHRVGEGAQRREPGRSSRARPEFKALHERLLARLQLARAHPRPWSKRGALLLQLLAGRGQPARRLAPHDAGGVPQEGAGVGDGARPRQALRRREREVGLKGVDCLYPDYERCLVSLSRAGADAVVVREFDIADEGVREGRLRVARIEGRRGLARCRHASTSRATSAPAR